MHFDFIHHVDISSETLDNIVTLKSKIWNYSREQHFDWISKNIHPYDIHLILKDDNILIGYLNIVDIRFNDINSLGVGNVCITPTLRSKNLGLLMMNLASYFIQSNHKPGILLCKDHVLGFYEKCNWQKLIDKVYGPDNVLLTCNILKSPNTNYQTNDHKIMLNRLF